MRLDAEARVIQKDRNQAEQGQQEGDLDNLFMHTYTFPRAPHA